MPFPDNSQVSKPIFIAGPHRSATSHLRKVISEVFEIPSTVEGYIWPIVKASMLEYDRIINDILGGAESNIGNTFFIKKISRKQLLQSLMNSIDELHKSYFESKIWLDKTPGHEMILSLPYLKDYFKEAKFIFIKRNGIENVLSRQRRFPSQSFIEHCKMWDLSMKAWEEIKGDMEGEVLVIEQLSLQTSPEKVSEDIIAFLHLNKKKKKELTNRLGSSTTEKTSSDQKYSYKTIENAGWDKKEISQFIITCFHSMRRNNYPLFSSKGIKIKISKKENLNKWCSIPDNLSESFILHLNADINKQPVISIVTEGNQNKAKCIRIQSFALNKSLTIKIPVEIILNKEQKEQYELSIDEPFIKDVKLKKPNSKTIIDISLKSNIENFTENYSAFLIHFEPIFETDV